MNVLVVGSGGREHALCWALAASPMVEKLFCAPGNAGIARDAECASIAADDLDGLVAFARAHAIELVVVGPELPLVRGLVDRMTAEGVRAFGPSAAAARLEGSKAFTKEFCIRHTIPTAPFRVFKAAGIEAARAYVAAHPLPVVVKVDGLAAGKGVTVAENREAALAAVEAAFGGAFGDAGATLIVEAFMAGEEASLFALCDGTHALEIGTAQDHKRAFDGDRGPNTGGMGAISPAPLLDQAMVERVMAEIVRPTLAGMAAEGAPFRGFLYAGLMLTEAGPKLVEYNVRLGDPEAQVILPRLRTDLCQLLVGACDGMLGHMDLRWHPQHALGVVMATRGYPDAYARGSAIRGLDVLAELEGVEVFHSGTALDAEGRLVADGGRVLTITGLGASLGEARGRAYAAVDRIDWPEGFWRRDIGRRALP